MINGQKVWTTSAQYADFGFILVCRTNPDVPKHQGISFLLVDMRQPGVEVRPLRHDEAAIATSTRCSSTDARVVAETTS